jgi:hypothetical protein
MESGVSLAGPAMAEVVHKAAATNDTVNKRFFFKTSSVA